jgi:hypothetical protein
MTAQDDAARRRLLWDVLAEHRNQGRHSETLRSSVAGYTLAIASALVTIITHDGVDGDDLPLSILVVVVGVVGGLFSAAYTERYHRNRRRADVLLSELDVITEHAGRKPVLMLKADADLEQQSKLRFWLLRRWANAHWLWLLFPIAITLLGIVLTGSAAKH